MLDSGPSSDADECDARSAVRDMEGGQTQLRWRARGLRLRLRLSAADVAAAVAVAVRVAVAVAVAVWLSVAQPLRCILVCT